MKNLLPLLILILIFGFLALIENNLSNSDIHWDKDTTLSPLDSPELVREGRRYFLLSCAHCHGDDALGEDDGSNLHGIKKSNAFIAARIKYGLKGEMPAFKKKYTDEQIHALVVYVRPLN